jgi:signal transduction histidine kinase
LIDPVGTAVLDDTTTVTKPTSAIADLSIRGQQFGILGIEEDADQPLTDAERQLFQQISEQVSEALEAARLFEQTQDSLAVQERLSAELGTVAEVSTAVSTILEADKLLQVVVDLAKESFNLYHAHVYLLDDDAEKLVLQAGSGTVGRLMVLEGREISIDSYSLVAQVARQKTPVIENRVRDVTNFLPHPLLPHTKSEMAVPLIVGANLIGVMDLQSDQEDYFTEDDIQVQRTLSSQIAVSIQNARLYAEQVEAAKKLRQVDQLKSEFLASMSHELRTPLNSIIGFSDILLEGLDGDLTERMDEDIRLIRGSGIHLRDLIGEILDMSKIEAGRMDLRYEEIDVVQLVGEIVATAKPLADERSLYLDLHIAPEVEYVEADRMRFRQIFYNIVSNGIKFTEKGGVTVDVRMNDENFLLVSVQDTGIGIKSEDVSVVFEQFRQIDGGLNRLATGTGLGMPITRNLIELHGGEIWVESTYGFGSTFLFTIPRHRVRKKTETGLLA